MSSALGSTAPLWSRHTCWLHAFPSLHRKEVSSWLCPKQVNKNPAVELFQINDN